MDSARVPATRSGFRASDCVRQGIAEKLGTPIDEIQLSETEHPVFLAFQEPLAAGDRIRFDVRINGTSVLTEDLELTAEETVPRVDQSLYATPVVELLAALPVRLAALHRLAETSLIEVNVQRNGSEIETLQWPDLVGTSDSLRAGEIQPRSVRSTVSYEPASQPPANFSCTNQCTLQQGLCYVNCGQNPVPACLEDCDNAYRFCLRNCGICQPSSTSDTTFSVVSTTFKNISQCRFASPLGLGIYRLFERVIKVTVTTTTTNADCSRTVTTNISYITSTCWRFGFPIGCTPLGPASPLC